MRGRKGQDKRERWGDRTKKNEKRVVGVRIHPKNARMSGRHGVQYVAQCVACAALTPVVWQYITNLCKTPPSSLGPLVRPPAPP